MVSALVEKAIVFALQSHAGQERKGQPGVPYVVHPMHVGLLLARHGFPDAVVAAGMLHDVVEDSRVSPGELARRTSDEVAAIVAEVTEDKARSWEDRKQHTIDSIERMSDGARAVTAADKVHNLADLVRLLGERGSSVWSLFRRGREPTLRYYEQVHEQLERHFRHPLTAEMRTLLEQAKRA